MTAWSGAHVRERPLLVKVGFMFSVTVVSRWGTTRSPGLTDHIQICLLDDYRSEPWVDDFSVAGPTRREDTHPSPAELLPDEESGLTVQGATCGCSLGVPDRRGGIGTMGIVVDHPDEISRLHCFLLDMIL
jgi:hypothetical protein